MREQFRIGDITVDVERREVRQGEMEVEVEPRVFDVLVYLIRHRYRVVSKDELLDAIWRERVVGDHSVYRAVRSVRELFGSESVIRTVHARGYRFVAGIAGSESAPAEAEDYGPSDRTVDRPPRATVSLTVTIAVMITIAVGLLGVIGLLVGALQPATERSPVRTLAIEPFINPDATQADAFLGRALAEEVAEQLGRVEELAALVVEDGDDRAEFDQRVRGRWTALDDRLLAHVELVGGSGRSLAWSRNFDEPRSRADALTAGIAAALMAALDLRPVNPAGEALPLVSETSGSAYESFLKARHLWRQRSPDALADARQLLEAAIEESPGFARAHEALASVYRVLPSWQNVDPELAGTLAVSAAREALRLEPRLGEARAILAQHAAASDDWMQGRKLFEEAIAREPGNATIRHWYAEFLLTAGILEAGTEQARIAVELDPLSAMPHNVAGWSAILSGDDEAAANHAAQAVRSGLPAAHLIAAWSAARQGRRDEAADRLDRLPGTTEAVGLCRQALLGRLVPEDVVRAILESRRRDQIARIYHMVCLAMLDRPDAGLDLVPAGAPDIAFAILWAPEFASLRRTEAFRARLAGAGLDALQRPAN